jgi:hypothetical protein
MGVARLAQRADARTGRQGTIVPTTHRGAGPPLAQSGFRAARRMDE